MEKEKKVVLTSVPSRGNLQPNSNSRNEKTKMTHSRSHRAIINSVNIDWSHVKGHSIEDLASPKRRPAGENESSLRKPANVNEFMHIISSEASKQTDSSLPWFTQLRHQDSSSLATKRSVAKSEPFSVYYKSAPKRAKSNLKDFEYSGNHGDIEHFFRHRLGPTPHVE